MTTNSPSRTTDQDGGPVNNTDGDLISEHFPPPPYRLLSNRRLR